MDSNSVIAYWVHGIRGVVGGLERMVEDRQVASEGTLSDLDGYIEKLIDIHSKLCDIAGVKPE